MQFLVHVPHLSFLFLYVFLGMVLFGFEFSQSALHIHQFGFSHVEFPCEVITLNPDLP
jgi:hypothetical protein